MTNVVYGHFHVHAYRGERHRPRAYITDSTRETFLARRNSLTLTLTLTPTLVKDDPWTRTR